LYLPILIVFPRVNREKITEHTVPIGLNIETKTGPLFLSAHPLKLRDIPLTPPAYAFSIVGFINFLSVKLEIIDCISLFGIM
jgi:hypothetical protein